MTDSVLDRDRLAAELVALVSDLIAIPSAAPSGDFGRIAAYVAGWLRDAGYATETVARTPGLENCVGRLGPGGGPSLGFAAQVDTAGVGDRSAWRTDPLAAGIEEGHVFGLGAGDAKGSLAVQLWLAREVARRGGPARGEIAFAAASDGEESGAGGLGLLREAGLFRPALLVLGTQTGNQAMTTASGVLRVRLTATGRAAAAGDAVDTRGDSGNAVMRMVRVLDHLDLELVPRLSQRRDGSLRSSLTVGSIHGGQGLGSVPALCTAGIDRRLLPRETVEDAVAELREAVDDAGEPAGTVTLELLQGAAGYSLPPDGPLAAAFAAEVLARRRAPLRFVAGAGTAGGPGFVRDGIDVVGFGPGAPAQGRIANESVPIGQMVEAALIQLGIVERILGFN